MNDEEALWHVADCSSSASTLSSSPLHVSCPHFVAVCSTQNLACLSVGVPASHGGGRLVITLGSARGGSGSRVELRLRAQAESSGCRKGPGVCRRPASGKYSGNVPRIRWRALVLNLHPTSAPHSLLTRCRMFVSTHVHSPSHVLSAPDSLRPAGARSLQCMCSMALSISLSFAEPTLKCSLWCKDQGVS